MDPMLILFARTVVEPSAHLAFSQWYDAYLPRRLGAAGFLRCTRLVNVKNPCEIVVLYEIASVRDLPSLLSERISERDPVLIELANEPPPAGIESISTGVYTRVYSHPAESLFNRADASLSIELWNWADPSKASELAKRYDEMYLSHLLEYPDHVAAFRFAQFNDPVVNYTNRAPANLSIIENPIDLAANEITQMPLRKDKAALFSNRTTGVFRPLAKYWSA